MKFKKLHPDAVAPTYATAGSACFDLKAVGCPVNTPINADDHRTFRTGLAFEIPQDHVMLIFSRSGHGFNNSIRLSNCTGVIDADYRGEVQVRLRSDDNMGNVFLVSPGDRIAQGMVIPVSQVQFVEATELGASARGTGGFGSTGA